MKEKDIISIIVPVYNVEKYLKKCLNSILNQTYQNLEIILVDDGSTDRSLEICNEFAEYDSRVKVFHVDNGGSGRARNLGIDNSAGSFIGFVDSDDFIDSNMYFRLYSACQKHNAQMACCGRYDIRDGHKWERFTLEEEKVLQPKEAIYRYLLDDKIGCAMWDKLFKKSLLFGKSFSEGRGCEDVVISYEAVRDANKIVHVGAPLYYHLVRRNSNSTKLYSSERLDFYLFKDQIGKDVLKYYPQFAGVVCVMTVRSLIVVLESIYKSKVGSENKKVVKKLLVDLLLRCIFIFNPYAEISEKKRYFCSFYQALKIVLHY